MGLLYCFLTVTLRANQNVTGLAMTTFGVGFGNFFGGSLIKLSGADVPSIALSRTSAFFSASLPFSGKLGWFGKIFLSYGFLAYAAVIIAFICAYIPAAYGPITASVTAAGSLSRSLSSPCGVRTSAFSLRSSSADCTFSICSSRPA